MNMLKAGDTCDGFVVTEVRDIPEFRGTGVRLVHEVTGCEVFHLFTENEENVFSFNFKTPPGDNTGVAHILEHSVLSGSKKYPLRDPFISLMNGSVQTYLNASTYPDKTIYPGATVLKKDYFNLMSVYGDAVFFPLLTRQIFMQEGHRIDVDEDGKAGFQGVVFSEMQGAYSSHDGIASEWSVRSLFPGSPLGFDSGGFPQAIPDLTYEAFLDFYRVHYHPSNCRVFLYGNIPTREQCSFLQKEFLSSFTRREEIPVMRPAERWEKPVCLEKTCALPEGQDEMAKTTILLNFRTLPVTDPVAVLGLEILTEALMGNEGSPITKAVQDSGLGDDLSPVSGLESHLPEAVLSIGIRGSEPEHASAFEEMIFGTLRELAEKGIPADVLEGALRSVEFRNREIRGGIPFGLRLMGKALRGWMNGTDPVKTMLFTPWMEEIKKRNADGGYFEDLIREQLLENPHRSTLIVRPDRDHLAREAGVLEEKLKLKTTSFPKNAGESPAEQTRAFYKAQEEEDPPGAMVPCLLRTDLPRELRRIDTETGIMGGIPVYSHDLFSNGILYIDILFDIGGLEDEAALMLPFFSHLVTSTGLPGLTYDEVARQLAVKTGGLYSFCESNRPFSGEEVPAEFLVFRVKVLEESLDDALDLVARILMEAVLDDYERIGDLTTEVRNDFRSGFLNAGHSLASLRASGRLVGTAAREESWRGVCQFLHMENLAGETPDAGLAERFLALRKRLFTRNRVRIHAAGSGKAVDTALGKAVQLAQTFPVRSETSSVFAVPEHLSMESLVAESTVGFAASAIPASRLGTEEHPAEVLLGRLLTTGFLWDRVRMRGGAYGVSAGANGSDGIFTMTSYRDPGVEQTLGVFREALEMAATGGLTEDELEKAVITVVGKELRPLSPGEESMMGLRRTIYGITDELRLAKHEMILGMDAGKLKKAAGRLLDRYEEGARVVLGGRALIDRTAVVYPEAGKHITVLPV